ncbi:MAG: hypothetical protein WBZ36_02195 [Candidatus Nitrosopolaris sp.]
MSTFSQGSDKFVFSVTIMILFALTIWIPSATALLQHQQTSFDVKITDPAEGKQVAIGKNLTLLGTSNYNPTSNCGVFIIVDGIKPYQKTTHIGQAGGNDCSKWKYTLTPTYAGTIEEGNNRITAKLVCQASPASLTTFHSIYVTGMNVPKQYSAITPNNATVVHVSSNTSSNLLHPRPLINHLSVATMHSTMANGSSSGSSASSRDHYHKICAYMHHLHHGKSSGYASRYDELDGSFGGGPGGSFGGGPGGSSYSDYP